MNAALKKFALSQNEALEKIKNLPENEQEKKKNEILKNFFELNEKEIQNIIYQINVFYKLRVVQGKNSDLKANEGLFKNKLIELRTIYLAEQKVEEEEKKKTKRSTKMTEKNGKEEIKEEK